MLGAQTAHDPQRSMVKSRGHRLHAHREGLRHREFDCQRNAVQTPAQLANDLNLKSGDFFEQQALDKDIAAVKAAYDAAGYQVPTVIPELRFSVRV